MSQLLNSHLPACVSGNNVDNDKISIDQSFALLYQAKQCQNNIWQCIRSSMHNIVICDLVYQAKQRQNEIWQSKHA